MTMSTTREQVKALTFRSEVYPLRGCQVEDVKAVKISSPIGLCGAERGKSRLIWFVQACTNGGGGREISRVDEPQAQV